MTEKNLDRYTTFLTTLTGKSLPHDLQGESIIQIVERLLEGHGRWAKIMRLRHGLDREPRDISGTAEILGISSNDVRRNEERVITEMKENPVIRALISRRARD